MGDLRSVYFVVEDMDRAAGFYETLLRRDLDFRDGDRWAELSTGGGRIALSAPSEAASPELSTVAVFAVDDLSQACDRVIECGGEVLTQRDMGPHGKLVSFVDTEGNIAQLFEKA